MCTYAVMEISRYVGIQPKMINRLIWICWTPKCKINEGKEVCLLCTVTIDNSINLWLPSQEEKGTDLYKLEVRACTNNIKQLEHTESVKFVNK